MKTKREPNRKRLINIENKMRVARGEGGQRVGGWGSWATGIRRALDEMSIG